MTSKNQSEDAPGRRQTAFLDQIRRAIRRSGASQYSLSREAQVPEGSLSRFVRGKRGLSCESLERVAEALGLEVVIRGREG